MDQLYSWAGSQPVWLQVVIGLALFFIVFPLLLLALFFVLRFVGDVIRSLDEFVASAFRDILVLATFAGVGFAIWLGTAHLAGLLAFQIGDLLSLSPARLGVVTDLLAVVFLFPALSLGWYLTYRLCPPIRTRVKSWTTEVGEAPHK